jgi:hypothetical protein
MKSSIVIWYCGVAHGEIVDRVDFTYPAGASTSAACAEAALTVNGVPAPAANQEVPRYVPGYRGKCRAAPTEQRARLGAT